MHKIRSQYPVLEKYTYLNTAYHGMFSKELVDYQLELSLRMHREASLFIEHRDDFLNDVKATVARFTDTDINHCYLLPNFSFGFQALLNQLPKSTRFLVLDEDYPSITDAVSHKGFPYHKITIREGFEDEILAYCQQQEPDFFCFSMVQYISGVQMNQKFIKRLKSEFPEMIIVVDGTQYLGVEEFRFRESGIDILIASCYKWLHAGDGCAVMLTTETAEEYLKENGSSMPVDLNLVLEPGHINMVTMGVLQRAIEIHERIGIKAIETHISSLSTVVKKKLLELKLIDPWLEHRKHSSIFNVRANEATFELLKRENIITSWRGDGIRISFAHYNSMHDFDRLIATLPSS